MPKAQWCHYVAERDHRREYTYLMQSGSIGGDSAFMFAKKGVEFPHTGEDQTLWLIRGGLTIALCNRVNNRTVPVQQNIIAADYPQTGYVIPNEAEGLLEGDGFEITPLGKTPLPGPNPGTVMAD